MNNLGMDLPGNWREAFPIVPGDWSCFPWLKIAYAELLAGVGRLGLVDAQGNSHRAVNFATNLKMDNPRIIEYFASLGVSKENTPGLTENVPWCSAFAKWCFAQNHIPAHVTWSARSWLIWQDSIELPRYGTHIPGSVVVFSRGSDQAQGHVGLVWRVRGGGHIEVLAGNQGAKREGGHLGGANYHPSIGSHVSIALYSTAHVLGFRWPKGYPIPNTHNEIAMASFTVDRAHMAIPSSLRPDV